MASVIRASWAARGRRFLTIGAGVLLVSACLWPSPGRSSWAVAVQDACTVLVPPAVGVAAWQRRSARDAVSGQDPVVGAARS
jgi:hypothetical protein